MFAVAILLWELIAGRRLYGGRSDFGVMKSIVEIDAPRPSLVWHECPPELEAIVMRGLRREREARCGTAEELQLALEAFGRERRLAVSNAGLGRYVRELFGERAAERAEGERTASTLYDVAGGDDDDAAATVVDGVVMTAASVSAELAPARQTRAVARRRGGRVLAAAGAGRGGRGRARARRLAVAATMRVATIAAPPATAKVAPAVAGSVARTVGADASVASDDRSAAAARSTPSARDAARAPASERAHARARAEARPRHAPAGARAPPSRKRVDLDAPLPPR